MQAGAPMLEAEKILEQVEAILKHAEKVKGNALVTATEVHGSNLQSAKEKPLLPFPTV
jgi:hypothetical protein